MAIIDRQKRGLQIGELRLGRTVTAANGKSKPTALQEFRITTKIPNVADKIAELFGGEPRPVTLYNGMRTIEVLTVVNELPILVPPGQAVISQWYEMWSAAGCQRRCEGTGGTEKLSGKACMCPADQERRKELAKTGSACKPITRLNVMLPDAPGLGVWLLRTGSGNAADELGGVAEAIAAAREAGVPIPGVVRLDPRVTRIPGEKPYEYVIPIVHTPRSVREVIALHAGHQTMADVLPPPPVNLRALNSGSTETKSATNDPIVRPDDSETDYLRNELENPDDEPIEAEIVEDLHDGTVSSLIASLDETSRMALDAKMKKANYPPVEKLQGATENQVRKWIEEITGSNEKGRPF